jgi:hypothetical protein
LLVVQNTQGMKSYRVLISQTHDTIFERRQHTR